MNSDQKIKSNENVVFGIFLVLTLGAMFGMPLGYWFERNLSFEVLQTDPVDAIAFAIVVVLGLAMPIIVWRPTCHLLERYVFKSYVIEDCGNVVKLYGSYRPMWCETAYNDLLRNHKGFKVFQGDAFETFGCTLAAVPAELDEMVAAERVRAKGVAVDWVSS